MSAITMIYHLIAIIVAVFGVVKGYRKGFFRQIPLLIGFCFGVVCARIFCVPVEEGLRQLLPSIASRPECGYVYSTLARGLVFIIVYELFSFCTGFLRLLFRTFDSGVPDSMAGSFFTLVRSLLILSIFYNFMLCWSPDSEMLRYAKSDDGNIIEAVMLVAPAILGGESVEDLAHTLQLEAAKCIS